MLRIAGCTCDYRKGLIWTYRPCVFRDKINFPQVLLLFLLIFICTKHYLPSRVMKSLWSSTNLYPENAVHSAGQTLQELQLLIPVDCQVTQTNSDGAMRYQLYGKQNESSHLPKVFSKKVSAITEQCLSVQSIENITSPLGRCPKIFFYRSSGLIPVFFAIRASIRGPISSPS